METHPKIIQGGMGVYVSGCDLARAVSEEGQQGTVSGVVPERVFAHILQQGDPGGHMRRALKTFPFPDVAKKVLNEYFVEGGVRNVPIFTITPPYILVALSICANYALVWLAKEGHQNKVSINYLEKVAMPHVYAITGAMLAGVDFITMGAGIPLQIPEVINSIFNWSTVEYRVPVIGKNITSYAMSFSPRDFFKAGRPVLKRPNFIPIISSNLLASIFITKLPKGSVYGFVVEEPSAGGHNAPPRNKISYGDKDYVDYAKLAETGLPFWIGGSYASPEKLKWALSAGAKGIQAGSIFTLCEDSNMNPILRREIRRLGFSDSLEVRTDMRISPTGFPFKVAVLNGTISEREVYEQRVRVCDKGGLFSLYERKDGSIGYRCPAEPINSFILKGGDVEETVGRGCLCNGLFSTARVNDKTQEPAVVTIGDDVSFLKRIMKNENDSYTAADAIKYLLGK